MRASLDSVVVAPDVGGRLVGSSGADDDG